MIRKAQLHCEHRGACNFFLAFYEFESFIWYFESWAPLSGFYVSASRMGGEALGSILLYGFPVPCRPHSEALHLKARSLHGQTEMW